MTTQIREFLLTQSLGGAAFDGARGLEVIEIAGATYLYVASSNADSIGVFRLFADGTAQPVDTVPDAATGTLNGVGGLVSATVDGRTFLFAIAELDDAVTVFEVQANGTLSFVEAVLDGASPDYQMDRPVGEISVAQAGGHSFLVAHGVTDDGISVFRIGSDGRLTNTANVNDADSVEYGLNGVSATTTVQIGGRSFVYASSQIEHAVTVFELSAAGTLTFRSRVTDDFTLLMRGASEMDTLRIGGRDFLFLAARDDDAITVFEIGADGALSVQFTYPNTTDQVLNGATSLDVLRYDGSAYLAVAAEFDDGLTLYEIGNDGSLSLLDTVRDSENPLLELDSTRAVRMFTVEGQAFAVASGLTDDGISIFQLGPDAASPEGTDGDDILLGTVFADSIDGGAGDDLIAAQEGDDTVNGGPGNDIVVAGDGNDRVLGDGSLTQTGSKVTTIAETGQDLALTVTLPEGTDGTTIEITGLINRDPAASTDFNIVYVIDVSGSMESQFNGTESVPDLNANGVANTLLDGTISAFLSLNESVVSAGFTDADVSIVAFETNARTVYTGSVIGNVAGTLTGLRSLGGTNFEAALQQAIGALNSAGQGENIVFFLSDGDNNQGGSFADEVATLLDPAGLNATINAVGLGMGASLASLDLVDDGIANGSAVRVLEPSSLTANLTGSPVDQTEVDRLEIHVNGTLERVLDASGFAATPLGLQYGITVDGLSTTDGDLIEVILVASDSAATQVSVALTVPNVVDGAGDDTLLGGNGDDTIDGNAGDDMLFGEQGNDALAGGRGNDLLEGGSGDDRLLGGPGDDTLIGSAGADTLQGGLGNDIYYADTRDILDERSGGPNDFDMIISHFSVDLSAPNLLGDFEGVNLRGSADASIEGNVLDNLLRGNPGGNKINGRGGADTILAGDGHDTLLGGGGDDTINGGRGDDLIFGGAGDDSVNGAQGADTIMGLDGDDLINGFFGDDVIDGGDGRDRLTGGGGDDLVSGGRGNDVLSGGNGADTLLGGGQNDRLLGGARGDLLDGGTGADTLRGDDGNDTLIGGSGNDLLTGGNQADTFVFADGFGQDTITDFDPAERRERIDLSGVSAITNWADLVNNHMTQAGSRVIIDDGQGNTIRVDGVALADLDAGDFVF